MSQDNSKKYEDTDRRLQETYAALKNFLNEREIADDGKIYELARKRNGTIKRRTWVLIIAGLCALAICPWCFLDLGCSVPLVVFTEIFLAVCICTDYFLMWRLDNAVANANVAKMVRVAVAIRKFLSSWLFFIGIPFMLVWLSWLGINIYQSEAINPSERLAVLIGMGAGAVIGTILGLRNYFRFRKDLAEIARLGEGLD